MNPRAYFIPSMTQTPPKAFARILGNDKNPNLNGTVYFYDTFYNGVLIEAELFNLPNVSPTQISNFYGFHIHENGDCTPPFDKVGAHYNPTNQPHPDHLGDMIPLLGYDGYAWMAFFDRRFLLKDIIGKSVVVHALPDDFTTQPSGNSGEKIGCGVITAYL